MEDLPTSMDVLAFDVQESSAPTCHEAIEKSADSAAESKTMASQNRLDVVPDLMTAIPRQDGLFTDDLLTGMEIPPIKVQESLAQREAIEQPRDSAAESEKEPNGNLSMGSEFIAAHPVRLAAMTEATRSQPISLNIETIPKDHAEEFEQYQTSPPSAVERVPANLQQLQAEAAVATLSQLDSERQRLVAETQQQLEDLRISAQAVIDDIRNQLAATVEFSLGSVKVAVEKTHADLDDSKQKLIEDTQKQLASMGPASIEPLARNLIEHVRAELDASKRNLIEDTQKQLASMGPTSLEPLAKDFIERVRAELDASKQNLIEDTQKQLAKMTQSSEQWLQSLTAACFEQVREELRDTHKTFIDATQEQLAGMTQGSLEPIVKSTVEQGRKELSLMTNDFLANSIPQIESAFRKSVIQQNESVQAQFTGTQITTDPRLAPLHPVPSQRDRLSFTLTESVPKRGVDLRGFWAELASGAKLGLVFGVTLIVILAIYLSSSPVLRLRAKPPTGFFDNSPSWNTQRRARGDQLARAYWDIAVSDIATKYGFRSTLPADPPDSFKVEENARPGTTAKVDPEARARYWEKLREAWPRPESWEQTSDWNLDWIRNQLDQGLRAVRDWLGW